MYLLYYLLFVNIFSAFLCLIDKVNAKNGNWRISEKMLFIFSLIGGSFAMYITMRFIRHKTLHKRFMVGLPIIMLLQIAALIYFFKCFSRPFVAIGARMQHAAISPIPTVMLKYHQASPRP